METITRKIGRNRGKPRLWIEGKALERAGLPHGTPWTLRITDFGLTIAAYSEGERKIAGKPGRPIVDIIGAALGPIVGAAASVEITIYPGQGVMHVRPAPAE